VYEDKECLPHYQILVTSHMVIHWALRTLVSTATDAIDLSIIHLKGTFCIRTMKSIPITMNERSPSRSRTFVFVLSRTEKKHEKSFFEQSQVDVGVL